MVEQPAYRSGEGMLPQNIEAEQAVLGSLLIDPRAVERIAAFLRPEDFYLPVNAEIYRGMLGLYERDMPADVLTLSDHLQARDRLDDMGGEAYLASLATMVPTSINVEYYARIVERLAVLRRLVDAGTRISAIGYDERFEADAALEAAEKTLYEVSRLRVTRDFQPISKVLAEVYETIDHIHSHESEITGITSGFVDLDRLTSGLQRSDLVILAGRPSMGKAQPLDTPILTASGWKRMAELKLGDRLASTDGGKSLVSGIYPQGRRQVYRVTFSDGRSTECCAEHLWRVYCREWREPRVLRTDQIMEMLKEPSRRRRLWIDTFNGDFGHDEPLPLDPWLLGAFLGDGNLCSGGVRISTADEEIVERLQRRLGDHYLVAAGGYDYRVVSQIGTGGNPVNQIMNALNELGLLGKRSEQKFIPPQYLAASRDMRLGLLQGLLDTDGSVEKTKSVCFGTCSEQLAHDVVELVRSLGGMCRLTLPREEYATSGGERKVEMPSHVVTVTHPDPDTLFTLTRKPVRALPKERQCSLSFASIEPSRVTDTQCISVTHPSRLYVTEDFIVTHNTALGLNIAHSVALRARLPVGIFSVEMSAEQLAQRFIAMQAQVDSQKLRSGRMSDSDWDQLVQAVGVLSESPIFVDDTPALSVTEMRSKARRLHAEQGLGLLMVDYLQLMHGVSSENRVQEISAISRALKAVARELDVPVLAISQLSRAPEQRPNHEPMLSDLRESGSIEQDADIVMFIYRDVVYNPETERPHVADLIVAKHRNGPTGKVHLFFQESLMRFLDLSVRDHD